MRHSIKFCGGCNPYYDPIIAAKRLSEAAGETFETYDENNPPDVLVLMNLCSAGDCLKVESFIGTHSTFLSNNEQCIERIAKEIESLIVEMRQEGNRRYDD